MFNTGKRTSQKCNGILPHPLNKSNKRRPSNSEHIKHNNVSTQNNHFKYLKSALFDRDFNKRIDVKPIKREEIEVKQEDGSYSAHSIIDLGNEKISTCAWQKKEIRTTHHETIQRLNPENSLEEVCNHYQKNWFSASLEKFNLEDRSREERIEITRHEFRRHLHQIMRSNLGQSNRLPEVTIKVKNTSKDCKPHQSGYDRLVAPKVCDVENCFRPALPCTKHCTLHIMRNPEQILFNCCTAKFADNTQCSTPVFDITHELPLCPEHARKRDNYQLYQEAKPKKLRKKVKPSAMIRPQKRNKKKKKIVKQPVISPGIIDDSLSTEIIEIQETIETESPELVEDMHIVDQVLGLNDADLTAQATHILEETDISTVLSTIHVDEFNDFFSVARNGEFEQPTREEAEELEKALAAVDNDVKSLEKLSQTHGLLDSLLDEHALAEQLVQLPDVFHNGYATCGDSMVAQTSSFLLPVEPHSHS